jgi:hypothetical protein
MIVKLSSDLQVSAKEHPAGLPRETNNLNQRFSNEKEISFGPKEKLNI